MDQSQDQDQNQEKMPLTLREQYLGKDIVDRLTEEAPSDWIWDRPGRGRASFKYVAGFRFVERLNECFGFLWSHRIIEHIRDGDHIVCLSEVEFVVPGTTLIRELPDGSKETVIRDPVRVVKQQFGGSEIKRWTKDGGDHKKGDIMDLADDYKGSATDSLKKCGLELGMFPNVYSSVSWESDGKVKVADEQQLRALIVKGEKAGMTEEEVTQWTEEKLGISLEEASTEQVMELIPQLAALAKTRKDNDADSPYSG